jgi:RNA polymerase sigma-70 factor, ECF subfamily
VQRKLGSFDGNAQLTTWLYAIALRVARRYRARAANDANKLVAEETSDAICAENGARRAMASTAAVRSDELERGERIDLARRALEALDEEKREAFVLSFVEQMSAPEIAHITGLPINTVYSRIRAARLAFSAEVSRLESVPQRRSP